MSETLSSGLTLTIPQVGERNWQTVIRTAFSTISGHDHTGSGNGVQIGTNALASSAVTAAKIATGVISADKMNLSWTSWTPTLTAGGSMTYTSTTITAAKYIDLGTAVMFYVSITGTTGGSAAPNLKFSLPIAAASLDFAFSGRSVSGGVAFGSVASMASTTVVDVYARDETSVNWGLGAASSYQVQGIYETA